jgi:hypothetical protein
MLAGVRRTVFMAYVLNMCICSYKYGWCPNWLFVESLPFDKRPGLWMAESPQAWIAAAGVRLGEEVGEQLSSYHAYGEALPSPLPYLCGDIFLTLVAYAHNGLGGN